MFKQNFVIAFFQPTRMSQIKIKIGFFSKILLSIFIAFFISTLQSFSRGSEKLYSIGNNSPWNTTSTWSLTSNGIPAGLIPQSNDTIVIESSVILNTNFSFTENGNLTITETGSLQGSNFELDFVGSSSLNCKGEIVLHDLIFSGSSKITIEVSGNVLVNNLFSCNSPNSHLVLGKLLVKGILHLSDFVFINSKGTIGSETYSGNGSISGVRISDQNYNGSTITECNWVGSVSDSWNEPMNWALGIVPNSTSNISVLASSNNPQIVTEATCNNLFINPAAVLTIKHEAVLEISGELVVNKNGKLLLSNSLISKASLILNGEVSGNIQSEYQIMAGQKSLLSSPVSTAVSSTFLNMYLRSYDEASSQWGEYIVPTNNPLKVMQGYELYSLSSTTRIFEGTPNHDPKSYAVTNLGDGLNLTGNPYPCYIDWENNDNNAWQRNAVASAIYYPSTSGSISVYLPGGDNAISLNNGNRYIAPMQGFFVKAGKQGSLTITENSRVRSVKDSKQGSNTNSIRFKLIDGNGFTDEAVFRVIGNSTFGFDDDYDALKLQGNMDFPSINFSSEDEIKYAINTIPAINASVNIHLNIECFDAGSYTISISGGLKFEQEYPVILEDKELNTSIDLRLDSVYTFYHTPEIDSKRFELHFNPAQGISENQEKEIQVQVRENEVFITGKSNETCTANLFSIDGKFLNSSKGILAEGIKISTGNYNPGIYILQIMDNGKSSTIKILIK